MKQSVLIAAAVMTLAAGSGVVAWVHGAEEPKTGAPAEPQPLEPPAIEPPPPIPDVDIPPIPPVSEKDPFKPRDPSEAPTREAPAGLLQEGKRLFDREGRLTLDADGHFIFAFDSGDPPMRLLENSWRQYLETVTDGGKLPARWRVSGLVTLYRNRNHLLLSKVVRVMPEEDGL